MRAYAGVVRSSSPALRRSLGPAAVALILVGLSPARADLPTRARAPEPSAIERSIARASTGSSHTPARPRRGLPAAVRVELVAAHANLDLGGVRFENPEGSLQIRGARMGLGRAQGFGGGFALGFAGRHFGGGLQFLYTAPDHGGAAALGAPVRGLHVARWALEGGWMHRFGDLAPFVLVQGALVRATADLEEPFQSLHGWRFSFGPRVGFRAFLHRSLYVTGAYFVELVERRGHVITLGLGLGKR